MVKCEICESTNDVVCIRKVHGVIHQHYGRRRMWCAACRREHLPRWTYAYDEDRKAARRKRR